MRFTITPLGSAGGRSVGQVVDDIVRYLDGPPPPSVPTTGRPAVAGSGPSGYYADGNAEPGRWLGNGAAEMSLAGKVNSRDFARVLTGRDPHTGVRLITAQGSSGRRQSLSRGTQTRWDTEGEPLYDVADAARALKLEPTEVERLVAVGEALAVRGLALTFAAHPEMTQEAEGAYLLPTVESDGTRWISEAELRRCEAGRAAGPDPDAVAAAGGPDDQLGLAEAARLAGVGAQYMRSLAKRWEDNRAQIEEARTAGEEPARTYLVAYRGTKGQWLVKRSDLVDYLRHRRPPAVRVGFDLTLTTEKSLGVLALLGDGDTRTAVLGAIQAGNDRGLAHLEYAAAMTRAKGAPISTRGWTVASFRHLTSRALDPFPHHHNVVANTVADPDGTRRALDARFLYRHAGEASALATAEMRHQLSAALGVGWRRGRKGGWEIDGIPDEVLREFSRRRNEIDEAVAELEALIGRTATIGELQGMVTRTRPAKRQADPAELVASWWDRARALGFGPRHLARCVGRNSQPSPMPEQEEIFARLAAPDGLCAGASVFTRGDVIASLVDLAVPDTSGLEAPLLLPADAVANLADDFLASDWVVELVCDQDAPIKAFGNQALFTTTEMLGVQGRILARFRAGRSAGLAMTPAAVLTESLSRSPDLTTEQADLVVTFATSGHRVQCGIGRAGAGKTTAMRAAAAAWSAAGYRVLGTAVKGEAARHLGTEAGIPTETLAWHLAHSDPASSPLDARTVLIVDEASTVSDRDLDRLLWLAEETGAALRLIGDPAQHGAVGAGGMFRVLCEDPDGATPELRRSHRVLDPHDRAAADALREGRITDALGELEAAGHLHVVTDEVELYLDLLERWWTARQAGDEHPMVDRRNHTRAQLNRLAHHLLQVTGEVGSEEVVAARDRRFSVGDRVVARRGDRSLYPQGYPQDYVRNGARGTVVDIHRHRNHEKDTIRVAFDEVGEVDLPREFFDEATRPGGRSDVGLDHAYALTSYAIQGATFVESTSRIDENASRSEAYVDITRGRVANHLYLTRSVDPLDGEHLPKAPPPPLRATVGHRLSASGPERAAVDIDPEAPRAAIVRAGRSLADLHAAATGADGSEPALVAATELRARQVARTAARTLPAAVLVRLPARSDLPYLARQWDSTVADLSVFLARWGVTPGGPGRWEWALGPRSDRPGQDQQRRALASRLADLSVATTTEAVRSAGAELPAWARVHLAHRAARGNCSPDPQDLLALYARIESYRDTAGVSNAEQVPDSAEEAIFGLAPDDPTLRAQRRRLLEEALLRNAAVSHAPRVRPGP
ncbi:MAG TPA: MobF family relaxase [Acidimicrobiales bacterium]|nr:MobF family relaxase [Acidimicrobiales bacterium]